MHKVWNLMCVAGLVLAIAGCGQEETGDPEVEVAEGSGEEEAVEEHPLGMPELQEADPQPLVVEEDSESGGIEEQDIGDTYRVTVHEKTEWVDPEGRFRTDEDERFVALRITVANQGEEPRYLSPFELELRTDAENLYKGEEQGPEPKYGMGTTQPGEERSGWVVFRVPKDEEPVELRLQYMLGEGVRGVATAGL